jgi:hypothetical protein
MPMAGIRLGDGGTLTIVANKCSIVRNAPCRMNMHPPRHPDPDPCPLLLPRSELHSFQKKDLISTAAARPSFPAVAHMSQYADSSRGARARSRVQGCQSSHNHTISLGELKGFPLVPCPDSGMARVVEGWTQKEGENHSRLYFKCARNSVSSLLCLPDLSYGSYVLILQNVKNCGYYHF